MAIALFDLDETLIDGDSDYLWGRFLAREGVVDGARYEAENRRFYEDYLRGTLDIDAFLRHQLAPLAALEPDRLEDLRGRFLREEIEPRILPAARALVARHRAAGDRPVIITATNRFITGPIARLLGVEDLIATEPERGPDGRYTGRHVGIPAFREGKVRRLRAWLAERGLDLAGSWFYSDSHNDLPLLELVEHPVAVDPDPRLARVARERGWPVISLRGKPGEDGESAGGAGAP